MSKRFSLTALCAGLLALVLVAQAQDEPVPTQSVADAVSTLIAQTQQAPNMTQTVQRALEEALTGTAQAVTAATATPSPAAPTPEPIDVDSLEVVGTYEFELMAGPGNTGAYLAPDGERFVYLNGEEMCLYLKDAEDPERCVEYRDTLRGLDPESIVWSPDSRYIAFTENFFIYLVDADIWVWDTTTDAFQDLTDDGDYRVEIGADVWKGIDVTPTWLDDGRIVFLRYGTVAADDVIRPEVYAIAPDGSGLEKLGAIEEATGLAAYSLDAFNDQLIFNFYRGREALNGVWTSALDGSNAQQVFADRGEFMPVSVSVSPVGRYTLINTPPQDFGRFDPEMSMYRVVDMESGEALLIDPERYVVSGGWSPDGSAFAYLVNNRMEPDENGLYLTTAPGEPGTLVFAGNYNAPTPRQRQPLTWGANNVILISRSPEEGVLLVELGS